MPKCIKSGLFKETCPTDLPAGVASSVHAVCAFKGDDKVKRCHLEGCHMDADCGPGANCKVHKYSDDDGVIPAVGICAYNAVNITHARYTFTINH